MSSPTPCALCGAEPELYGQGKWYCPNCECASNPKELRLGKWNALNAAIEKAKEEAVEVAGDYTGEECPVCKRHRWMKNGVWESCEKCEFVLHEDHAITLRASLDVRFASAVREAEEPLLELLTAVWARCEGNVRRLKEHDLWTDMGCADRTTYMPMELLHRLAAHRGEEGA